MSGRPGAAGDPWAALRALTPARIALGRAGGSLPTSALLAFEADHAAARDAVWSELDLDRLEADLEGLAAPRLRLATQAADRQAYLQRPDLGRRLDPGSEARLAAAAAVDGCDVAVAIGDGLSATAAQRHAPSLLLALAPRLAARGLSLGPVALVRHARVAVEDRIGAALGARLAIILLGERPGLGAPDSLGAYLVHRPRPGATDADRNCVSNVRPEGLPIAAAAELLDWLVAEALRRALSGVALKDERNPNPLLPLPPRGRGMG